ncbi:hypothetical protein TIFTF001_034890 [Ficus carica]|uniref:Uncharacterized protein n=1 Tax=Ficus carica TaxID=3494 RepID=A0AA88J5S2_FICCA|nr:hypothetical protein TIFTF001_034890 [Ficus carica]
MGPGLTLWSENHRSWGACKGRWVLVGLPFWVARSRDLTLWSENHRSWDACKGRWVLVGLLFWVARLRDLTDTLCVPGRSVPDPPGLFLVFRQLGVSEISGDRVHPGKGAFGNKDHLFSVNARLVKLFHRKRDEPLQIIS